MPDVDTPPISESLASPDRADRVIHYEYPWTVHAWMQLRRPPRVVLLAHGFAALYAVGAIALLSLPDGAIPGGRDVRMLLSVFVFTLFVAQVMQTTWQWGWTSWKTAGGHDRIAFLKGTSLTIGSGTGSRTFDLTRARRHGAGRFVRLDAPIRRWYADDVPASLLDGIDVPASSAARPPGAGELVIATTWRDARADVVSTLRSGVVRWNPYVTIGFVAAALAIPAFSPGAVILLVGLGIPLYLTLSLQFVGGWIDPYRNVAISGDDDGLHMRDDGYAVTMPWSEVHVLAYEDRVWLPSHGQVRRRPGHEDAFDELVAMARLRAKSVTDMSPPRALAPATMMVRATLRAALFVALVATVAAQLHAPDLRIAHLASIGGLVCLALLAFTIVTIVPALLRNLLLRPPSVGPHHRPRVTRETDDSRAETWNLRDLRWGVLGFAGVPLLVAGAPILVAADIEMGSTLVGASLAVFLVAARSLPDLHREITLLLGAATAGGVAVVAFVLASLQHPDVTLAAAAVVAIALVAVVETSRMLDGDIMPAARLSGSVVSVAVLMLAVGSFGGLLVVDRTRIDVTDAERIVAHPQIGATPLRGVRLSDAYRDVDRVTVTWRGDTPRLESSTGFFEQRNGDLARERLTAMLREAADEPGPRPRVREIVLSRSWYGVASNHAVNHIRSLGTQWPESATRWIREETRKNDWISYYFGVPERIVISRRESANLLDDLRAPSGTRLDSNQAYSFHVLRHEIEHGMSSGRGEPDWLTEGSAEILTQWAGREDEVLQATSFEAIHREQFYGRGYEQYGRLLFTVLEACRMSPAAPARFGEAARLLRDPSRTSQSLLASCLVKERGLERDGLESLLRDAGHSKRAREALLERIREAT